MNVYKTFTCAEACLPNGQKINKCINPAASYYSVIS
jgi:hypothetical protein